MTFLEAKEEVKQLANGRFHAVVYELSEHQDGTLEQTCSVYVDGQNWQVYHTWEEAISMMRKALGISNYDFADQPGEGLPPNEVES